MLKQTLLVLLLLCSFALAIPDGWCDPLWYEDDPDCVVGTGSIETQTTTTAPAIPTVYSSELVQITYQGKKIYCKNGNIKVGKEYFETPKSGLFFSVIFSDGTSGFKTFDGKYVGFTVQGSGASRIAKLTCAHAAPYKLSKVPGNKRKPLSVNGKWAETNNKKEIVFTSSTPNNRLQYNRVTGLNDFTVGANDKLVLRPKGQTKYIQCTSNTKVLKLNGNTVTSKSKFIYEYFGSSQIAIKFGGKYVGTKQGLSMLACNLNKPQLFDIAVSEGSGKSLILMRDNQYVSLQGQFLTLKNRLNPNKSLFASNSD